MVPELGGVLFRDGAVIVEEEEGAAVVGGDELGGDVGEAGGY